MKKIIYIISLISVLLTSCSDWLDVNTDPDKPSVADPKLTLTAAMGSTSVVIGGQYSILGSLWGQHFTQNNTANQYKTWDSYTVDSKLMNSEYYKLYAQALFDYRQVLKKAEASGDWNLYLAATVMDVYVYQVLADLYEKIPYSEAVRFDEGISKPKFDDGPEIYADLLVRLDNALSKDINTSSKSLGASDLVFGGDMSKWIAFANTLKLKIAIRQYNAKNAESTAVINKMLNDGVSFLTTDASITAFTDEPGRFNPLYDSEFNGLGNANLRASNTTLNFVVTNNDPRLPFMYEKGNRGDYEGLDQGDYTQPTSAFPNGAISKGIIKPTDPVVFISAAESEFLQAEALLRFKGGVGAKEKYDAGVTKAFARFGIEDQAAAMLASGAAYQYDASNLENSLKSIITQKWLSCFLYQGLEAFFEFNRTGYPTQFTVSATSTLSEGQDKPKLFVRRLVFTEYELTSNPANVPARIEPYVKLWWAK